jgi:hypothetical protein
MTDYPHHGPITPDCPVECLLTILSRKAFNPLTRVYNEPFDPPRTVGDVADLHVHRMLPQIRNLGPRHISEIEAALVLAGIDITNRQRLRNPNPDPGQAEVR